MFPMPLIPSTALRRLAYDSDSRAVHKLLQFSQKVAQKLLQKSKSCSKVAFNFFSVKD